MQSKMGSPKTSVENNGWSPWNLLGLQLNNILPNGSDSENLNLRLTNETTLG
jgi:hypothetical protein